MNDIQTIRDRYSHSLEVRWHPPAISGAWTGTHIYCANEFVAELRPSFAAAATWAESIVKAPEVIRGLCDEVFNLRCKLGLMRRIDQAGRDVTDLPGLWDESDRFEEIEGSQRP